MAEEPRKNVLTQAVRQQLQKTGLAPRPGQENTGFFKRMLQNKGFLPSPGEQERLQLLRNQLAVSEANLADLPAEQAFRVKQRENILAQQSATAASQERQAKVHQVNIENRRKLLSRGDAAKRVDAAMPRMISNGGRPFDYKASPSYEPMLAVEEAMGLIANRDAIIAEIGQDAYDQEMGALLGIGDFTVTDVNEDGRPESVARRKANGEVVMYDIGEGDGELERVRDEVTTDFMADAGAMDIHMRRLASDRPIDQAKAKMTRQTSTWAGVDSPGDAEKAMDVMWRSMSQMEQDRYTAVTVGVPDMTEGIKNKAIGQAEAAAILSENKQLFGIESIGQIDMNNPMMTLVRRRQAADFSVAFDGTDGMVPLGTIVKEMSEQVQAKMDIAKQEAGQTFRAKQERRIKAAAEVTKATQRALQEVTPPRQAKPEKTTVADKEEWARQQKADHGITSTLLYYGINVANTIKRADTLDDAKPENRPSASTFLGLLKDFEQLPKKRQDEITAAAKAVNIRMDLEKKVGAQDATEDFTRGLLE